MRSLLVLPCLVLLLAGCEQVNQVLGLEDSAKKEARLEAEGRAVGGACRHSGRAIEDCYSIYTWLPKAAVFGGWRDMDTYMRENSIETVTPQLPPPEPPGKKKKKPASEENGSEEKPAAKKAEEAATPDKADKTDKAAEKPAEKSEKSAAKH